MTSLHVPEARTRPAKKIHYPDSDGKPMGETDAHVDLTIEGKYVLRNFFADQPDVYVAGNNFIYYEEGNPKACVSPDGYLVFGVPMKQRNSYKVWEEGGKMPAVVFEYTSRATRKEDEEYKKRLYEQTMRVQEYFLFDPKGEYLRPRLQGFRLVNAVYVPIPLSADRLFSEQLNLFLEAEGTALRFRNAATGERLRTMAEEIALRVATEEKVARETRRAQQEAERAEQEAKRAEHEARRAEQEAGRAEQEAQRAKQEAERAEQEAKSRLAAELRAEQETNRAKEAEAKLAQLMKEMEALKRQIS